MGYAPHIRNVKETSSDLELERLNAGWLGKIFGIGDNASNNIAGFAVIIGFLLGGIFSCINVTNPFEIWSYITPIITGALGYIFGRGAKPEK